VLKNAIIMYETYAGDEIVIADISARIGAEGSKVKRGPQ
jgi:hypothetical protein